jgi:dolichyl-diphosphooligosaccharide--protein glycosyltransferase
LLVGAEGDRPGILTAVVVLLFAPLVFVCSKAKGLPDEKKRPPRSNDQIQKLNKLDIDMINEDRENTPMASAMYEIISQNLLDELVGILAENPEIAHVRSGDGRGPMWWAHEYKRMDMIALLKELGVTETRTDEKGISPLDLH